MNKKPIICISLGDAAGIGSEIVIKSLANKNVYSDEYKYIIIGSKQVFEKGQKIVNKYYPEVAMFASIEDAGTSDDTIVFLDIPFETDFNFLMGQNNKEAGKYDYLLTNNIIDYFKKGFLDAFVFAPVNKKSMEMGGSPHEGYKACLAHNLKFKGISSEINILDDLWTTRVTSHMSIKDVPNYITKDNIANILRYFNTELVKYGIKEPLIAVSGLNPHNGDKGIFGNEEQSEITPAIEEVRKEGINAFGPVPADTIFLTKNISGIVCMYHDQCQIATKLMGFFRGVTYFGGLPFPLSTPAHGTAFDIAGKGIANETPFINAVLLAKQMVGKEKLNI
jgi:4-hydroxythreonine-4-phosphate dehydrogenase